MAHLSRFLLAVAVTFAVLLSGTAAAKSLGGVQFADEKTIAGKPLKLNGLGMREATVLNIDVYVAGLYVEKTSTSAKALLDADAVKHLVLKFVRDVSAKNLSKAWADGLAKNGGGPAIKKKIKRLDGMMNAVKKGDRMSITYVPGKGVEVKMNGKSKGTVEGKAFARWLFAIWLGPNPPNAGLKKGLLGRG